MSTDKTLPPEIAEALRELQYAAVDAAFAKEAGTAADQERAAERIGECYAAIHEALEAQQPEIPPGYKLVPDWKGYALLGTGNYVINHSAPPADPELGAELIITLATDADRSGNRQIGESRDTPPDAPPIQPEDMVIRIGFLSERGLFALEDQLQALREAHGWTATPAAPAQETQPDAHDAQRDIDAEGQRAAIHYGSKR